VRRFCEQGIHRKPALFGRAGFKVANEALNDAGGFVRGIRDLLKDGVIHVILIQRDIISLRTSEQERLA
jgi:hypothetical protein